MVLPPTAYSFKSSKNINKNDSSDKEAIIKKAELKYIDNIPIIKLKGSYYEMGYQYGFLLKYKIKEHEKYLDDLIDLYIKSLPLYYKPFIPLILNSIINKMKKRLSSKYLEELKGLSDGSGISYKKYIFIAFGGGILSGGCTSMMLKINSRLVHGRNFDFMPYFLGKFPVVVEYNPDGKNKYTNFGVTGYPGMFHGINEKGISTALNYGAKIKNSKNNGLPAGYKIREILASSNSLDDVDKIMNSLKTDEISWIISVCSFNENKTAIYDACDNIIMKDDSFEKKYKYAINKIFSPDNYHDCPYSKKYLDVAIGAGEGNQTRENVINGNSEKIKNIDGFIGFLRNTDFYNYKNLIISGAHTISCDRTIQTVIFDYENNVVYFASNPGYSSLSKIYKYNLKNNSLSLYKNESPDFLSKVTRDYLDWLSEYQMLFYTKQYKEIINITDFNNINLSQINYIYDTWKKDKKNIDVKLLVPSIDKYISLYEEYSKLYLIKANIIINDTNGSINYFEKALSAKTLDKYSEIEIYENLVNLYRKIGNKDKAGYYANKYINLIDELKKYYKLEKKQLLIYNKIKNLFFKR